MDDQVVKVIDHPSGGRRVEIYQRRNGTFGFDELEFDRELGAWHPTGRYSYAVIDTAEAAEREARGRVSWLQPN